MKSKNNFPDVFSDVRKDKVMDVSVGNEKLLILLDWRAVRTAAKDWQNFSSNAPFRIPIPSEESVRCVRQIPIELDPPLHTEIRQQLMPWFRRPMDEDYRLQLASLISQELQNVKIGTEIDLVRQFALPLQSRALALLLNMDIGEADIWIEWGTHVFRDGDDDAKKGRILDSYIRRKLEQSSLRPSADFFSALHKMKLDGRALTEDEKTGMANLVFAGGRDTVITMITIMMAWFAQNRDILEYICSDSTRVNLAVEEFLRVVSPLTHIGRVCPYGATIEGRTIQPGERVGLSWASANYDPAIFKEPETLKLDRVPNPHVAFGSGVHNCIGALQARAILRLLLRHLVQDTRQIDIMHSIPHFENAGTFSRNVGFDELIAHVS